MSMQMKRTLLLAAIATWGLAGATIAGEEGDVIRAQLEAHEQTKPELDQERGKDVEYMAVYRAEDALYTVKKIKLIGDLWRAEPEAPELPELMTFRWKNSGRMYGLEIAEEVEAFAEARPDAAEAILEGRYSCASNIVRRNARDFDKAVAAADGFVTHYPDDERGASLLYQAGRNLPDDDGRKAELTQRILERYPESRYGKRLAAERRRDAAVGKPFEMSFTDYITGDVISMEDLRGQVVVIDFWAVWCGPCKASLPHLKELYARYHESGMEIIGVSLDNDPQVMIDFCKENDMTWPQYCEEGKVWDTEFSTGWGISAIPSMFIVDRNGVLRDVKARGKLDDLLPELLGEPAP